MARQKSVTPATIFNATLRLALEHVADPEWLGKNSPLATPYFLGVQAYDGDYPSTAIARGLLLQKTIHKAFAEMWDGPMPASRNELATAVDEDRARQGNKSSRYRYLLLELRYLRRHYPSNTFPTSVEAIPGFINSSPTRFFIHLEEAIDELGRCLLGLLNPALRLEQPILTRQPVGRTAIISAILTELRAGRSVAVTGVGGIGKSTVGAKAIAQWTGPVFWYTFHPGLNDDLSSLLFSLGHFMRNAGAPSLWAQLLAGEGAIGTLGQALGMLRFDLETIANRSPLLCFDEVDLLQTAAGDPRRRQHAQVLELLESLRGVVPLLLLGQRVYVDTDSHFPLEPLEPAETGQLLQQLGLKPDSATFPLVQQFTRGNPRLLELYAALRQSGEEASDLLRLSHAPSAQPLFSRLWRRLEEQERDLLATLSAFRSYAPRDTWADRERALIDLTERGLIKADLAGGVALLPFIRGMVYTSLSPVRRRRSHKEAAVVRAKRGDYTAAAYHYVEAGEAEAAIEVWFAHREEEILSGQAAAADEVFRSVNPNQLDDQRRIELRVIQNRLALLSGEADRVLEGMEAFKWDADDEVTAEAIGQWAHAYELRERSDSALEKYDEAITRLSGLATKIAGLHWRRGLVFLRELDTQSALLEVELAQHDLERLRGAIEEVSGRFERAQFFVQTSLQIAQQTNDINRIADAHYALARIAGRLAHMEEAETHAEAAIRHYQQIGNLLALEGMRAELAGMYLNVRKFEKVIEPSEKALRFFERVKHDLWISTISTNLAEAYLETGRLDKAKELAFKALQMEIPKARPYALYTLGHIHDRQGNPAHAETSFAEGIATALANGDPFIEAYLERALGAMLARGGRMADGAAHLEAALKLFREMGLQHEVTETEAALQAL